MLLAPALALGYVPGVWLEDAPQPLPHPNIIEGEGRRKTDGRVAQTV